MLNRLSITAKLLAIIVFLCATGGGIAAMLMVALSSTVTEYDNAINRPLAAAMTAARVRADLSETGRLVNLYLLQTSPGQLVSLEGQVRDVFERERKLQAELFRLAPEEEQQVKLAAASLEQMEKAWPHTVELQRAGDRDGAVVYWADNGRSALLPAIKAMMALREKLQNAGIAIATDLHASAEQRILMSGIAAAVLLSLGAVGAVGFSIIMIARPLRSIIGLLTRLSGGDSNFTVTPTKRADEIGDLTKALQKVQEIFGDITHKTKQVAGAVTDASAAIGQVSSGARQQTQSIDQVSQALGESAKAITLVSDSSKSANDKGANAAKLVERGQGSADQLAQVVEMIAQNSRKISQITQVIAGIANRTHILSLNAAIEAARAGEHGKGFVVVAQEVGKLAESAAQNAQQITDIVEQATNDSAQGRAAAAQVREIMNSIAGEVSQTSQMIRSISVSMEEQQAVVTTIESNLGELRSVASGNSVAAEEITATMIQLSQLADEQRKRLSGGDAAQPAAA